MGLVTTVCDADVERLVVIDVGITVDVAALEVEEEAVDMVVEVEEEAVDVVVEVLALGVNWQRVSPVV